MGRGASYRPPYANEGVPSQPLLASSWKSRGNKQSYVQDAWRSYRQDSTSLSGPRNNRALNPEASEFAPANALASHLQRPSGPAFKQSTPLRFWNRTSEAQPVRSFRNSGLNSSFNECHRNDFSTLMGENNPIRTSCYDRPLPSIESRTDRAPGAHTAFHQFRRSDARRGAPQQTPERVVSSPVAPEASQLYLAQARLPPTRRSTPQKCLVILDLNGTCIARPSRLEPKVFKVRPGIHTLFDYLFQHHVVMIFTSMHRSNAAAIVEKLFTSSQREQVAALWARDKLGLTAEQLHAKTQTYKNLIPIWLDRAIQSTYPAEQGRRGWNQSNTVLIDDSHLKAVSHPHNLLLVPEFAKADAAKDKLDPAVEGSQVAILQSLISSLEELKYQTDVSRLIREWQTGKAPMPQQLQDRPMMVEEGTGSKSREPVQLLTPVSTMDTLSEGSQDDDTLLQLGVPTDTSAEYEEQGKRAISEVPETVWADLLKETHIKSQ